MVYVIEDVDIPGVPTSLPINATVSINLVTNDERGYTSTGKTILSVNEFSLNSVTGQWLQDLTPNTTITNPTGTVYRRIISGSTVNAIDFFDVPTANKLPLNVTAASRTSNVVTLTLASTTGYSIGDTVIVDLGNNSYDGVFTLTNVTGTTLVYPMSGADLGTSTGTVAKPWPISERLTSDPTNLPTSSASNEVDTFTIAADASAAVLTGGFDLISLANTTFTVPDSSRPHILTGIILATHSVTGQVTIVCAPVGTTTVISLTGPGSTYMHIQTATTIVYGAVLHAYFAPHSAGNYQLFANGPAGNFIVKGSAFAQTRGILLGI